VAEQVLAYLDVPRDVPLVNPRMLRASYRRDAMTGSASLEDFTPTDFSSQADQLPEALHESKPKETPPAVTVTVDEGGDIGVPDFSGMTMRDVTERSLRLGLDPVLVGSGLAMNQTPRAEARVRRGAKITVQFGTPVAKKKAPHKGTRK
jgi:PASTA domain